MNLLLDTHTLLWYVIGSQHLSTRAKQVIDDPANRSFLSPVVFWEIAIIVGIQKLQLTLPFDQFFSHVLKNMSIQILPIELRHAARLIALPHHHRDPFDRLLIAQALADGLTLVSSDGRFDAYSVPRVF